MNKEQAKQIQAELQWSNAQMAQALGISKKTVEALRRPEGKPGSNPVTGPIASALRLAHLLHRQGINPADALQEMAQDSAAH